MGSLNAVVFPDAAILEIKVEQTSRKVARASEKPINAALNCIVLVVKRKLVKKGKAKGF
jgi:hypothetical protein